jgi:hypothetical protein
VVLYLGGDGTEGEQKPELARHPCRTQRRRQPDTRIHYHIWHGPQRTRGPRRFGRLLAGRHRGADLLLGDTREALIQFGARAAGEAEVAWIRENTEVSFAITSAIPPVFEAYATLESR